MVMFQGWWQIRRNNTEWKHGTICVYWSVCGFYVYTCSSILMILKRQPCTDQEAMESLQQSLIQTFLGYYLSHSHLCFDFWWQSMGTVEFIGANSFWFQQSLYWQGSSQSQCSRACFSCAKGLHFSAFYCVTYSVRVNTPPYNSLLC